MGHLINIVNQLVNMCSTTSLGQFLKDTSPDTFDSLEKFKETTLQEINKTQEMLLVSTVPLCFSLFCALDSFVHIFVRTAKYNPVDFAFLVKQNNIFDKTVTWDQVLELAYRGCVHLRQFKQMFFFCIENNHVFAICLEVIIL